MRYDGVTDLIIGWSLYNFDKRAFSDSGITYTGGAMPDIQDMIGREVELIANGIEYRGTLIEVSDEAVFLKMTTQWMELPAASVSDIRLAAQYRNVQESEGIDEAAEEFG